MSPYTLPDGNVQIAFSGGRTSAFMLHQILEANGPLPERVVVSFQNTGREFNETLDFVQECGERWNVRIVWLEYRPEAPRFEVVSHNSAARNGEPFDALIGKRGLPNRAFRFCTQEMKQRPASLYAKAHGWRSWLAAVGIRADEAWRCIKKPLRERWQPWYPLVAAQVSKRDVSEFWSRQPFDLRLSNINGRTPHGNCDGCFAAETEVVTSQGIKRIGDLAGTTANLLVPKRLAAGSDKLSEVGSFVAAPIQSFGIQRLWRIDLAGKGRAEKTVFATAEHRWFLAREKPGADVPSGHVLTSDLRPGDKLRNLFRCPIGKTRGDSCRLGALRGFAFGDGTGRSGSRPGVQLVYEGKDEAFTPLLEALFGCGKFIKRDGAGKGCWAYYGIPDYWKKQYPDLGESRRYLMGWLAGYFAADGCVSEDGSCTIHSATKANVEFVRSLCAVLGIQHWPIKEQSRLVTPPFSGARERLHTMYSMNINRHHVTADFFWLEPHRARAEAASDVEVRRFGWTVKAVAPTDRVEEVFCATVDGIGAFALADGIMTGNCFLKSEANRAALARDFPERFAWWVKMEELSGSTFRPAEPYAALADFVKHQGRLFDETGEWCQADDGECFA